MATSRTGTTRWLNTRRACLKRDREAGITTCPLCGVTLDYNVSRLPNSAEADHIVPHAQGGEDTPENTRTVCRRCNQSRGGKQASQKPIRTSREW